MVLRITASLPSGGTEEPLDGCSSSLSLSCSSQGPQAELKKLQTESRCRELLSQELSLLIRPRGL